ncbi:22908_t:CDS:1, partial [Cetraspora pellucida]
PQEISLIKHRKTQKQFKARKPKEHISEMLKDKNKIRKPKRLKKISKPEGKKKKLTQLRLSKKPED